MPKQLKEFHEVETRDNRQRQIESLDIGDSVSISRRFPLTYGISEERIVTEHARLRGILDQQTIRARRRMPEAQFITEAVKAVSNRSNGLHLIVIATRIA